METTPASKIRYEAILELIRVTYEDADALADLLNSD